MKRSIKKFFGGFSVIHWIALAFILILLLVSLLIEQISSLDPIAQDLGNRFAPVGAEGHPLGTDQHGAQQDEVAEPGVDDVAVDAHVPQAGGDGHRLV